MQKIPFSTLFLLSKASELTYPGNKQCQKEQHGAAAVSPRSGVSLHGAVPGRAIVRR